MKSPSFGTTCHFPHKGGRSTGSTRYLTQGREITACGFTLIELLVVVLIIGILAAVALPQYQKAVLKVRTTQLIATVNALQKAVDLYVLENGYPSSEVILWNSTTNLLGIDIPYPETTVISSMDVSCNPRGCVIDIWGDSSKQGDGEIGVLKSSSTNQWTVSGGGVGNFASVIVPALTQAVAAKPDV